MFARLAIVATLALAILPAGALSQTPTKAAAQPRYIPPRLADGRPDLSGAWLNDSLTPLERDPKLGTRRAYTEDEARALNDYSANHPGQYHYFGYTPSVMRVDGEPRTSLITYPANGRVELYGRTVERGPERPERLDARYDNPEDAGLARRCIVPQGQVAGPIMLPAPFGKYLFVQGKDTVAIWVEMMHDVRVIRIGGKHLPDRVRPYMGDSIGHYEGDTLVVETTNFPANTSLYDSSVNLKVIEKFTQVSPTRMRYQFEVRDLLFWARPWGGEYEFERGGRGQQVFEYACHEGNYALEDALVKSRAADQARR